MVYRCFIPMSVPPDSQMGEASMNVRFDRAMSCWTWSCIYGCWGWDYEGEQEAIEGFLSHDCEKSC